MLTFEVPLLAPQPAILAVLRQTLQEQDTTLSPPMAYKEIGWLLSRRKQLHHAALPLNRCQNQDLGAEIIKCDLLNLAQHVVALPYTINTFCHLPRPFLLEPTSSVCQKQLQLFQRDGPQRCVGNGTSFAAREVTEIDACRLPLQILATLLSSLLYFLSFPLLLSKFTRRSSSASCLFLAAARSTASSASAAAG